MRSKRVCRKRLLCASAAVAAAVGVAGAADAGPSPYGASPPTFPSVDKNRVDLTTGNLSLSDLNASVGQPGQGGLARIYMGPGVRDNLSNTIAYTPLPTSSYPNQMLFVVSFGDVSSTFLQQQTGGPISSLSNVGTSLTYNSTTNTYAFTGSDGTVATFGGTSALVTQINRPTGEVVSYVYSTQTGACGANCLPVSVTSSLGYMIHYDYAAPTSGSWPAGYVILSKVTAFNRTVDRCDPTAATCAFTQTWSATSFTFTPSNPGAPSENDGTLTATDADSRQTSYLIVSGKVTQITRPTGGVIAIGYDANGRASSVSQGANPQTTPTWAYAWTTLYNGDLRVIVTEPLNNQPTAPTTTVVTDSNWGLVNAITDSVGHTTTYHINGLGEIDHVQNPEGDTANYTYDARGNATTVTRSPKPGSTLANYVLTLNYDSTCSNPVKCNQPNWIQENTPSAQTDFTYEPNSGQIASITRPAAANGVRPQTNYSYTALTPSFYNGAGQIVNAAPVYKLTQVMSCMTQATCSGTSDQAVTNFSYGAASPNNLLLASTTSQDGTGALSATTQFTYTPASDVSTTIGPLGSAQAAMSQYDPMRQLTGQVDVDPDGQGTGRPALARKISYNGDGVVGEIDYGTSASQSGFPGNFTQLYRHVFAIDAYDHMQQDQVWDAANAFQTLTEFTYYANGQLRCSAVRMNASVFSTTPGNACAANAQGSFGPDRISWLQYDTNDQLLAQTDAYGTPAQRTTQTLTYTANGRVQTIADGNNNLTTYAWDAFDRLSQVSFPSPTTAGQSSTTDYLLYTYNPTTWNVDQLRLRDGQIVTNSYDWRHNLISKNLPFTNYTFDNFDRLASIASGGQTFSETYDALGRRTAEAGPLGTVASQYDAAGRRTRLTLPGGYYTTYDYDTAGAMIDAKEAGTVPLFTFGYDNNNRLGSVAHHDGVNSTYGYDTISRLTSIIHTYPPTSTAYNVTVAWSYDPANGINSRALSNSAYQWGGSKVSTTYTNDGQNKLTGAGSASFAYDGRGNMTNDGTRSYGYDAADRITSAGTITLAHDPFGRLSKTVDGAITTQFLYDGPNLVGVYDGNGSQVKRFVHGPGINNPLLLEESGTAHYPLADERGSIMAMADISGNMLAINTYDEYGLPGSANYGDLQYTGQIWLPNAGVYDYKTRAYSPTWGRFLQSDRIGYQGGMNLYAYVENDPVNGTDPNGLQGADVSEFVIFASGVHIPQLQFSDLKFNFNVVDSISNIHIDLSKLAGLGAQNKPRNNRPLSPGCSALVSAFSRAGDSMQNSGLGFGLGGLAVTALAPEGGVGEVAASTGAAMYAVGTAMKDSASITNLIFNNGNGSGYALGRINDVLLNNIPKGPARDLASSTLDKAEAGVGLSKGDFGSCSKN